jgi:hypothetical protein
MSHIKYCIIALGGNLAGIEKQQKRAIRFVTCSKYNMHTEHLLKNIKIIKASDIFTLAKLKFYECLYM